MLNDASLHVLFYSSGPSFLMSIYVASVVVFSSSHFIGSLLLSLIPLSRASKYKSYLYRPIPLPFLPFACSSPPLSPLSPCFWSFSNLSSRPSLSFSFFLSVFCNLPLHPFSFSPTILLSAFLSVSFVIFVSAHSFPSNILPSFFSSIFLVIFLSLLASCVPYFLVNRLHQTLRHSTSKTDSDFSSVIIIFLMLRNKRKNEKAKNNIRALARKFLRHQFDINYLWRKQFN